MPLTILSPDFNPNEPIPSLHTCDGDDVAPRLGWSGVPAGCNSLALIVDDPDAPDPARPKKIWVHWVLYDIPPSVSGLPRAASSGDLPPGTIVGTNEDGDREWSGPCPPVGRHRYFFRLYALGIILGDRGGLSRKELDTAMAGHIIEEAFVMGTYQRQKS